MSSTRLRRELLDDPLVRGYGVMTDAAVLVDLNDATQRPLPNRSTLSSSEIYEVVVRGEYQGLSAADKAELNIIFGLGENIPVGSGSKARGALAGMFDGNSETRPALLALIDGLFQSRATELGLRNLTEGGIAAARMPDQP